MVIKLQKRLLLAIGFGSYVRSSVNSRLPEDEITEFLTTVEAPLNGPPLNNGHFFGGDTPYIDPFSNLSSTATFSSVADPGEGPEGPEGPSLIFRPK